MELLMFVVLLLIIAFFAAAETAIFSVSKFKLHSIIRERRAGAAALAKLKSNPNRLLATILIGVNSATIFTASFATVTASKAFGSVGVGLVTGLVTIVIIVFGESLPKSLAAHNSVGVALFCAKPLEVITWVLYPAVLVLETFTSFFTQMFSGSSQGGVTEEELKSVIAISKESGVLAGDTAQMMENVIEFEDVKVDEVMTPEISVVYLDGNKSLQDVMNVINKTEYSRFPVYTGDVENIIGVFDTDSVLREVKKKGWRVKVKELVFPPFIIPEGKKLAELLAEFSKQKIKFALVVDEHGSFVGVVSLDDILEEIVGDIFDKSLAISRLVKPVKGGVEVKGSVHVSDLEKLLHVSLKGDGFTTLAGLIETNLGRIPQEGEKVKLKHFEIEIEDADSRTINRVKIYRLPTA
jgi:CBS domain containing-hemolysin-like protein